MTEFEIERKIDSWLHCRVTIPLKTGSNPFSALNDRANDRYEVDVALKMVILGVGGVFQPVLAAPSGKCRFIEAKREFP